MVKTFRGIKQAVLDILKEHYATFEVDGIQILKEDIVKGVFGNPEKYPKFPYMMVYAFPTDSEYPEIKMMEIHVVIGVKSANDPSENQNIAVEMTEIALECVNSHFPGRIINEGFDTIGQVNNLAIEEYFFQTDYRSHVDA